MGNLLLTKLTFMKAAGAAIVILSVPWALEILDMAGGLRSLAVTHGIKMSPGLGYSGVLLMAVAPSLTVIVAWVVGARCRRPVVRGAVVLGALMCGVAVLYVGFLMLNAGFPRVTR
jgi:multisubunit Na+/H+ antiporter MnhB subunit